MPKISPLQCCVCNRTVEPELVLENTRDGWHILRCPVCDLTFAHPQPSPEAITSYYVGLYSDLASNYDENKMEAIRHSVRGYLRTLSRHRKIEPGTSFLDLGGGLGYYAKAFAESGVAVTLVEQDPVSLKFARNVLKIDNIIATSAEQFFRQNRTRYDVIFLRHVIEHVTDPAHVIAELNKCLADGGILVIETDNNAGIELMFRPGPAKFYLNLYKASFAPASFLSLMSRRPFAVDPPRHLFGFRMSNLASLLQNNALIPVEKKCYRLGHPIYWPNMPLPTLREILANAGRGRFKLVAANILDVLFAPLRRCLEVAGMASGICIYARKS